MTVQFIRTPDGDELAVLPRRDYEDLIDEQAGRISADALLRGDEELLSAEETKALVDAPTALLFWREKRGLDRARFGRELGIDEWRLAEIETGTAEAPLRLYGKAAELLGISLDDLAAG